MNQHEELMKALDVVQNVLNNASYPGRMANEVVRAQATILAIYTGLEKQNTEEKAKEAS